MSFTLWCAVSVALVGGLCAIVSATSLPAVAHLGPRLAPRARTTLLELAAIAPFALTVVISGAVMWPALAGPDHCHALGGHQPPLCPLHSTGTPSIALAIVALLVVLRVVTSLASSALTLARASRVERELRAVARPGGKGIEVLPLPTPLGFVLGLFRPRLFVSDGLLRGGGGSDVRVVLEHERAHARSFHPLRSAIASLLLSFHLPLTAVWLKRRLHMAYESVADADAARAVGDPLRVAEAIVRTARNPQPLSASAFNGGDLAVRIDDLLSPRTLGRARSSLVPLAVAAIVLAVVICGAGEIHHGLETLLGWLHG